MTNIVLDASAVLAYYNKEHGYDKVVQALDDIGSKCICHIHAVNAMEVFYKIAAKSDAITAKDAYYGMFHLGIEVNESIDVAFQLQAATLKTLHPMLSLADVIAITLAEKIGGTVYTTDRQFNRAGKLARIVQLRP